MTTQTATAPSNSHSIATRGLLTAPATQGIGLCGVTGCGSAVDLFFSAPALGLGFV
jgi:hypothetical protein